MSQCPLRGGVMSLRGAALLPPLRVGMFYWSLTHLGIDILGVVSKPKKIKN
jgi:hypothetical protein